MQDKIGAGAPCSKCGKIVYIAIFNEYPLGDSWTTNGKEWSHKDCKDTLAISGKTKYVEYLPTVIQARIKQERQKLDNNVNEVMDTHNMIEQDKITYAINIIESIIPKSQKGTIAKSCEVLEK